MSGQSSAVDELWLGMKREGLRVFASELLAACNAHPDDEGIEVERTFECNGDGPRLRVWFNNDDMERDEVPADAGYWDK